jgi:TetR/AcrR family transcriptional regulator, cholesterol catabolism regulator
LAESAVTMPADGRSPGRRGAATREAIDQAAIELFAELGYHATSMRAIAAAAGVQPAAIYHWYPGKEAILTGFQDEFMERLTENVEAAVERQDDAVVRLAAAVREHVVYHARHPREAFVTDSEIRALAGATREALLAQRDAYQRRFVEMIDAGVRAGSLRTSDVRVAAFAILLQCTGVALWFDPDGPLGLDRVADLHVELVLGSVGASRRTIERAVAA